MRQRGRKWGKESGNGERKGEGEGKRPGDRHSERDRTGWGEGRWLGGWGNIIEEQVQIGRLPDMLLADAKQKRAQCYNAGW